MQVPEAVIVSVVGLPRDVERASENADKVHVDHRLARCFQGDRDGTRDVLADARTASKLGSRVLELARREAPEDHGPAPVKAQWAQCQLEFGTASRLERLPVGVLLEPSTNEAGNLRGS